MTSAVGDGPRPDPDALLARVQADDARKARARLNIYFGFAPGVGKTYAMLETAQRLVAEGVDLIVGVVETHGRGETAELLHGLEMLPRVARVYRGRTLDEFDLDGALLRRPQIVLLDELAHTNVPGGRHAKRWHDVMELLDAGIEVHSTLNVQHIESLNNVVEQITRVQVRETVPDAILERADTVELVDLSPEELLQRLRDGKVYLSEKAALAAEHFFQRGNLLALRELALRQTAQRVDADVRAYREQHAIETAWPAAERLLVCVGPSPNGGRLVRATRRMAAGLRAPWVALTVDQTTAAPVSDAAQERVEAHLRLAESLGATVARLTGASTSRAVLNYARKHNITRIIVGKSRRRRLRDVLFGSLLDELVRGSGDIDVHVIKGDEEAPHQRRPLAAPPEVDSADYGVAAAYVGGATVTAFALNLLVGLPDVEMLFLMAIALAGVRLGRGPALLASGLSVAAYDFAFVEPRFTFSVGDGRYWLTFGMMFALGVVLSGLTARLKRQEQDAVQREQRTASLFALSHELGAVTAAQDVARIAAQRIAAVFDAGAAVFVPAGPDGPLECLSRAPAGLATDEGDLGVARWVLDHGRPAGVGTVTLPGARSLCVPLTSRASGRRPSDAAHVVGVLALLPAGPPGQRPPGAVVPLKPLSAEQRAFLNGVAHLLALCLERGRLADDARAAALKAETETLRSSLLSAVSHDLRTPISGITGAATTLRDEPGLSEAVRTELLGSICDESERLERLVANLLEMTRLASGGFEPRREWVPVEELVGSTLARLRRQLASHQITTALPDGLPLVSVDPVVFEQALVNLLENAAKYSPRGSTITVRAGSNANGVWLEVADQGPGLPSGEAQRVFEPFYRGRLAGPSGVGLGLAIARAVVLAHGGTISARTLGDDAPRGAAASAHPGHAAGSAFRINLPVVGAPPAVPSDEV